jgi:hypothetical protein
MHFDIIADAAPKESLSDVASLMHSKIKTIPWDGKFNDVLSSNILCCNIQTGCCSGF